MVVDGKKQGAADILIASSLRKSLNVGGYDPSTDSGFSGFTWPAEVGEIAKSMGFKDIQGGFGVGFNQEIADEYVVKQG